MTGREGNRDRQFSQVVLPAKVRGEAERRSDLEGQDLYFVSKIRACLNADGYWPLKEG